MSGMRCRWLPLSRVRNAVVAGLRFKHGVALHMQPVQAHTASRDVVRCQYPCMPREKQEFLELRLELFRRLSAWRPHFECSKAAELSTDKRGTAVSARNTNELVADPLKSYSEEPCTLPSANGGDSIPLSRRPSKELITKNSTITCGVWKKMPELYGGYHQSLHSLALQQHVGTRPRAMGLGRSILSTTWRGDSSLDYRDQCSTSCRSVSTTSAKAVHVDHSQHAVGVAIITNALVLAMKVGVYITTASSVVLAEAVHSVADLANQCLLAYGLYSSKRAPDSLHPYGYSKERFVWSLISAVGIFCLGSGVTIVHGIHSFAHPQMVENVYLAAAMLGGALVLEGTSFIVAYRAVRSLAVLEGLTFWSYLWKGDDPTSVAVLMEDGAAVTGLGIAALSLAAMQYTGNPIWDAVGTILIGNLLGVVAMFLIKRNRSALLGRSMDEDDTKKVITFLSTDAVVDAVYDCKSEVIGPGAFRFKAEIDFNGEQIVQNYLKRVGRVSWYEELREAVETGNNDALDQVMAKYGEEVVSALGYEVDRLEKEIQILVPDIRHVDIEAHNPNGPPPSPNEKLL